MRLASRDGMWIVDLIQLSLTGTGRDGDWLRVSQYEYFTAEVRAWSDLARYLDADDLQRVDNGARLG